ncbi:MAG TPA: hypothetical protein ENK43_11135 [Planctomycetes bacterium]|nr:hypothetical protein [Planctomycetota bacterium]
MASRGGFRRGWATVAVGVLFAGLVQGQVAYEFAAGTGLGFNGVTPKSPVVRINDTTGVIVSPSATPDLQTPTAAFVVIHHALGLWQQSTLVIPQYGGSALRVFPRVYRLDDKSFVSPAPGPDDEYGTADDEMLLVDGLDFPGAAQVQQITVGTGTFFPGQQDLLVLSPNDVAWVDLGGDKFFNNGNDNIVVLRDLRGHPYIETVSLGAPTGIESNIFSMGEGRFGFTLTGADHLLGTADDEIGTLRIDAVSGNVVFNRFALGRSIDRPAFGARWPRWAGGDRAVYTNAGPDGTLGTTDDLLMIVNDLFGNAPQQRSLDTLGQILWNFLYGPQDVVVLDDGTLVLPAPGADRKFFSPDDGLFFAPNPFLPNSAQPEVVPVGGALGTGALLGSGGFLVDVEGMGQTAMVGHIGADKTFSSDDGFAVVAPDGTGARQATSFSFFQPVLRITPFSGTRALVFLGDGTAIQAGSLGSSQASFHTLANVSQSFENEVCVLNPTLAMGTRSGSVTSTVVNDFVQLWKVQGSFVYGEATANAQGYDLIPGLGGAGAPEIGGGLFFATLEGAPPSSFCYLMISTGRDEIQVLPDAKVFVSFEEVQLIQFWLTYANGSAQLPLIAPTDPGLAGLALHFQWMVFNPLSFRGFELSRALTLVM